MVLSKGWRKYFLKGILLTGYLLINSFVSYSQNTQYYFTEKYNCVIKTIADNVFIRKEPNSKSKWIKKIPIGTELFWSNEKSLTRDTVLWNGKKTIDYWYKVFYDFNQESYEYNYGNAGWIFGKGVKLVDIDFGHLDINDLKNLNNDWLSVELVNEKSFNKIPKVPVKWIPGKPKTRKENGGFRYLPFTLKFLNGKSNTYKNDTESFESDYVLLGELPELAYYLVFNVAADCSSFTAVNKINGKNFDIPDPYFTTYNKVGTPTISPDHKTIICAVDCEPGGAYDTFFVSIDKEKVESFFEIQHFIPAEFRFITAKSGIAKFKKKMDAYMTWNFPEKDTYIRISIK